jgi:hypothetical protein
MAVAMPRLMPRLMTGNAEAAARHLAGYGRAVMAQASFDKEYLTVRVDPAAGEYWTVRVIPTDGDQLNLDAEAESREEQTLENVDALLAQGSEEEMLEQAMEFELQFDRYFRRAVEARSQNIKRTGIFEGTGDLFEEDFQLQEEDDLEEEVKDDLLLRQVMPDGVIIESVQLGEGELQYATTDIDVSPVGIAQSVVFIIVGEDGDRFTVTWDAITGAAHIERGSAAAVEVEA